MIAFLIFRDKKCDYVILECGVGGLGDATNIIEPGNTVCTAITSIGLDHVPFLGTNLAEIAG